jgi:hypothetical protein
VAIDIGFAFNDFDLVWLAQHGKAGVPARKYDDDATGTPSLSDLPAFLDAIAE